MKSTNQIHQPMRSIPERHGLSYAEFAVEYLFPNQPVILTDGLKGWTAVGKWTPDFFRQKYSGKSLEINGHTYSVDEFFGLVENSSAEQVAPYFRNQQVQLVFPELLEDLQPPPPYILPNWLRGPFYPSEGREAEIYIGGAGGQFPIVHYDGNSTHAFLGQVYGEKEAVLYSPAETHLLYPKERPRNHSFIADVENFDAEKFPLFAQATALRGVLKPGYLIFIPDRWWHSARMLSASITISYNVANRSNWKHVTEEVCYKVRGKSAVLAPLLKVYMAVLGLGQGLVDLF
ncbi:MAG: cupin-like domain-containing protein [Verrucomicrobiota bacterium]